ncbi:hypothetical protein K8R62_00145 [bacterium]|nr:hypothetical protein [bacterium]
MNLSKESNLGEIEVKVFIPGLSVRDICEDLEKVFPTVKPGCDMSVVISIEKNLDHTTNLFLGQLGHYAGFMANCKDYGPLARGQKTKKGEKS